MSWKGKGPISFEEGWPYLQEGITKIINNLDQGSTPLINPSEVFSLYTLAYMMCNQNGPYDCAPKLYEHYGKSIKEYLVLTVQPSLMGKCDENLLKELVKRWKNHQSMANSLGRIFRYLDRYFVHRHKSPALGELAVICFYDLVYKTNKVEIVNAAIALLGRLRQGQLIDHELMKNVVEIFVEFGMGSLFVYKHDFETPMLDNVAAYYKWNASGWICRDDTRAYMAKVQTHLLLERQIARDYLHPTSESLLLKRVHDVLMAVEKDDLPRMLSSANLK
ncbi:putative cullin-like protein 2 isoform X2 [Andrographis paniculata]|nr:putative cullin-like protein 2 isoform X2 [Andrographis paniculata]